MMVRLSWSLLIATLDVWLAHSLLQMFCIKYSILTLLFFLVAVCMS